MGEALRQDKELLTLSLEAGKVYWSRIVATNPGRHPLQPETQVEFEYISDETQRLPFVIGPESTVDLHGLTHRQVFKNIGVEASHLDEKVSRGLVYRLVVFEEEQAKAAIGVAPVQATWEGLLQLMEAISPASRACHAKLLPIWDAVKAFPCVRGGPIDVLLQLSEEERSVVTSFEGLAAYTGPVTPELGRKFIRHTLRCTPLFRGDGYSWTEDGVRAGAEYLIPRVSVESLQPTAVVSLCWDLN